MSCLGGSQGVPLSADIPVSDMIAGITNIDPARKASLIEVLDIDMSWRMHRVSDGQRRRVQILLGLIRPFKVLLLDEVTTDLDVCARVDLLAWLKNEAETTGAAVLYATHILDGLESWASHLSYMSGGKIKLHQPLQENPDFQKQVAAECPCPLLRTVEGWLRHERENPETIKVVIPVDPNKKKVVMRTDNPFARKQPMYDYSH
jgi:CCR4-NOT complex subunit CAF16